MLSILFASLLALVPAPQLPGQRLDVLFIGDRGHHQPDARLNDVYGPLLRSGFAIDWEDQLELITPDLLDDYDCVVMYANQAQHNVVPPAFLTGLRSFVREGGGFVALHCTSGCFMQSQEWLEFVGARFVSHGAEIFEQEVVEEEHVIMDGWQNFEAWDETYVQTHFESDRVVLTTRGDEPWSWIRKEGEGRVFYSASGHDERVWKQPAFLELLIRAMDWAAGPEAASNRAAFKEPIFEYVDEEWVSNYEGRSPHPVFQLPSTPEQARAALIVPAGFHAELFAAEPMVVNPIAMAWDESGRCWVIESPDYPNSVNESGQGLDRISILEDTTGDGRADKKTVFKQGLNLPTSLLVVEGGVVVTQAPDLLLLLDTDGDDVADRTEVLFSGFGRWDTHAGPSNLRWGPDNGIWGAVGYASFEGEAGRFGSGLWRWDSSQLEPDFVAQFTNNTWGLGFRSDGELFGSTANGAPSFYVGTPKHLIAKTAPDANGAALASNTALFHPALEVLRQGDYFGKFTAAAGHAFATGSQLSPGWVDRSAFVCGPTGHLVGRLDSYADGSGWRTRDAFNLCTSVDDWFCPVQAEVGPDGAVWIADFSQFIILHNLPGNPERGLPKVEYGDGNAHLNPLRDNEHGRIFRIVRDDEASPVLDLQGATDEALVAALQSPNQFWRVTARRLLVEGKRQSAAPALLQLRSAAAVRTLSGLGALENEAGYAYLKSALAGDEPALVKAALQALPVTATGASLLTASGLLESSSKDLLRAALLAAARMPSAPGIGVALAGRALQGLPEDAWLSTAFAEAVATHAAPFLTAAAPMVSTEGPQERVNRFPNPGFEKADNEDESAPLAWRKRVYSGAASHTWEQGLGRNGSRALAIRSSTGADTSWCTDVPVQPNHRYELTGWIKTEGVTHPGETHGALLNIHPLHVVTSYVQDDQDWTQVRLEFSTGPDQRSVSINCLYGGWGQSQGRALYDDLELVSLGAAQDLSALLEVARTFSQGEPDALVATDVSVLLLDGDAAAGRSTFFDNEVVSCFRCHAWNGEGGGIGPDLADLGTRMPRSKILESILDPNAELAKDWPAPVSAMPALRAFLTDEELRDLVHFLSTASE